MPERRCRAWLLLCAAVPLGAAAQEADVQQVVVTGQRERAGPPFERRATAEALARRRAGTSDTAVLLQDLLGVSLGGAGGVSSLPALNGLGGDRVRTQVDGMELVAACPNHMNSPLSYLDPSQVGQVRVHAGVAPVSVGGDSLGGTIVVDAPEPVFAEPGAASFASGSLTAFHRGAGQARGGSAVARLADERLSLGAVASTTRRGNLRAARAFKPAAPGTEGGPVIPGDVIASSAYDARNDELTLATRHGAHLLQFKAGRQDIAFEGFPNQRMDMTANRGTQLQLRYTGRFDGAELQARAYQQKVEHAMDMGPDRYRYGFGMPMLTEAVTRGAGATAVLAVGEADLLRLGVEGQTYVLYDWWPAVGGAMGPNAFWNVDFGRRDKAGAFAEWELALGERWAAQVGVRLDRVRTDAADVQGYDNGLGAIWGNEAAAFNALDRRRSDRLLDAAAIVRHRPAPGAVLELGLARKNRAPNLYQRYPWSTQPMAALMNNVAGDGNGYIGNPDLRPETAHTAAVNGRWHDADAEDWSLEASAWWTHVHDYIDARRCDLGQCGAGNATATQAFVLLQYANQRARLQGLELTGRRHLMHAEVLGNLSAQGTLKLQRGRNLDTGDRLYNQMPPQLRVALEQRRGDWSARIELEAVAAKDRVSQVRNEIPTPGYALLHLQAGHTWGPLRLEAGVDNLFDRFHRPPLAGAYLGQGRSMTSAGIPWGVTVPGPGRSFYLQLTLSTEP